MLIGGPNRIDLSSRIHPNQFKTYALTLILVLATCIISGCSPKEVKPVEAPVPDVSVQLPDKKKITEFFEYIGRTEAPEFVEVRARVTGYLTKIHFTDGKEVAAGEPLFEIDNRPYLFALDNAKARL